MCLRLGSFRLWRGCRAWFFDPLRSYKTDQTRGFRSSTRYIPASGLWLGVFYPANFPIRAFI